MAGSIMKNEWSKISLIFLFLIALIGTLIRSIAFVDIPIDYQNLLHAHSHVAFQGWVYTIIFLFLTKIFLTEDQIKRGRFPLQFKLTVIVVIGVLFSFILQSYRAFSITISTLFQLLNYWFIFQFFKMIRNNKELQRHSISLRFIKTGLWLGLLSTLVPYAIGIISAKGLGSTEAYPSLIYTFLHLQYNGWFLFVVLGLFFHFLDKNGIRYNQKYCFRFYWLMSRAVIPAVTLSFLGMSFAGYIMPLAYLASVLTAAALVYFLLSLPNTFLASLKEKSIWFKVYFMAFLGSFILKMVLQSLSVLPMFKSYAFFNKFIIMAYLHLSLIGAISFLFIALMIEKKWLPVNGFTKIGSVLFVLGFAATELMLLLIGLGIYYNQLLLAAVGGTMALGIFFKIISGRFTFALR